MNSPNCCGGCQFCSGCQSAGFPKLFQSPKSEFAWNCTCSRNSSACEKASASLKLCMSSGALSGITFDTSPSEVMRCMFAPFSFKERKVFSPVDEIDAIVTCPSVIVKSDWIRVPSGRVVTIRPSPSTPGMSSRIEPSGKVTRSEPFDNS